MKFSFVHLAHYPAPVRLGAFLLLLLLLWLPFVGLIEGLVEDPNTTSILVMTILFVEFVFLLRFWGQRVGQKPYPLQSYGLVKSRQNGRELLQGLGIGLVSLMSLFILQGGFGWLIWQTPPSSFPRIMIEGLLVSLGVALGEELIFRGWLLDELQRDYGSKASLLFDSAAFACLHFIKPWGEILRTFPQFPGLLVLGLALVWAKRRSAGDVLAPQGRLGLPIGLHAGLVWGFYIVNVGKLIQYTNQVPEWLTGVDQNPLAGGLGLLFLGAIAFWMRMRSRQPL